jgi:hypothetical protein
MAVCLLVRSPGPHQTLETIHALIVLYSYGVYSIKTVGWKVKLDIVV